MSSPVFTPGAYRDPDARSSLPGLALLAGIVGAFALCTHPSALWGGAPLGLLAALVWGTHRTRTVVIPWLADHTAGHPLRLLAGRPGSELEVRRPPLRPWLTRAVVPHRWTPVLVGTHQGWPVAVGPGWVAVDLGESVPRLSVPLDRGRFWRDVLFRDRPGAVPPDSDGQSVLRACFGPDSGGLVVPDPLAGWARLESIQRADPHLARATLIDGHLLLPALQAGVPGTDPLPTLQWATDAAARFVQALDDPWHRLAQAHRLYRVGAIRSASRRATGTHAGLQLTLRDHPRPPSLSSRINGPTLAEFSAAVARAFHRQRGVRQSVGAALRWTPLLAWDDQSTRLEAALPHLTLPANVRLRPRGGGAPEAALGHPVLDRLAGWTGPATAAAWLRRPERAGPLVELFALSPTTELVGGSPTRIHLDLPTLDTDRLFDAVHALQALSDAAQRAETQPAPG